MRSIREFLHESDANKKNDWGLVRGKYIYTQDIKSMYVKI